MFRVGIDRDQAVGCAEQLVDRPRRCDAYPNTLDLEIGVAQRRVREERARGQGRDQLGKIERDFRQIKLIAFRGAAACTLGATSLRCYPCSNKETH